MKKLELRCQLALVLHILSIIPVYTCICQYHILRIFKDQKKSVNYEDIIVFAPSHTRHGMRTGGKTNIFPFSDFLFSDVCLGFRI